MDKNVNSDIIQTTKNLPKISKVACHPKRILSVGLSHYNSDNRLNMKSNLSKSNSDSLPNLCPKIRSTRKELSSSCTNTRNGDDDIMNDASFCNDTLDSYPMKNESESELSDTSSHDYDDILNRCIKSEPVFSDTFSHDYDDILDRHMKSESDLTYINLNCMLCSKKHVWKEAHQQYTHHLVSKESIKTWGASSLHYPILKKSQSLEGILDSQPKHNCSSFLHRKFLVDQKKIHQLSYADDFMWRSNSHDDLITHFQKPLHSSDNCLYSSECVEVVNPPNTKTRLSKSVSRGINSAQSTPASYEKIINFGPYEEIPKVTLSEVPQYRVPIHIRSHSDSSFNNSPSQNSELRSNLSYESIKNFGPYEKVPNFTFNDIIGCEPEPRLETSTSEGNKVSVWQEDATQSIKRLHQKPKCTHDSRDLLVPIENMPVETQEKIYKTEQGSNHHQNTGYESIPNLGPYESIQNSKSCLLKAIKRKFKSTSDVYSSDVCSSFTLSPPPKESENRCNTSLQPQSMEISTPAVHQATLHSTRQCLNHTVMNLESPKECSTTETPQALPYAIVWLDRLL